MKLEVLKGGEGYDVINPPISFNYRFNVGSGATGTCSVKGIF